MTVFTDVFGSATLPPSEFGFQALSITANTTTVWPYNSTGGTAISKIIDLTATAGLTFTLPNATEVSTGEDFLIRNVGAESVAVLDYLGGAVATVAAGAATYFYLTDNSTTDGTYGVIAYGVGTSSIDAASLVGYGIVASGSTLNQSHPVLTTGTPTTLGATHRASLVNYTGGADTLPLTSAPTLGDNFFTILRNSGTGTLTIEPSGIETIDGAANIMVQPGESLILFCSGAAWFSVGYGRSVLYNFTQLVKDISGGGTITLTPTEASNKLLTFIGNPATTVTVIVPPVVAVYYTLSSLSTASDVIVKTAAGTGSTIAQGQRLILIADGTNVYSAQSVTGTTSYTLVPGTVVTPSLNFVGATQTGLYKYSTDGLGFAVAGVDVGHFTDTGLNNAPIGVTDPQPGKFTTLTATGTTTLDTALTGLAKLTAGVVSAAASGTDYAPATSGTSVLIGDGAGGTSSAVSGTDIKTVNGTSLLGSGDVPFVTSPITNILAQQLLGGY